MTAATRHLGDLLLLHHFGEVGADAVEPLLDRGLVDVEKRDLDV